MVLEGLISEAQSLPAMCGPVPLYPQLRHHPGPCHVLPGTFSSLPRADHVLCMPGLPTQLCKEAGLQAPSGQCPAGERGSEDLGYRQRGEGQESESQEGSSLGTRPLCWRSCQGRSISGSPESSSL